MDRLTPLQTPANPYSPGFREWARVTTIRLPELPMGWPRATAPPLTVEARFSGRGSRIVERRPLDALTVDFGRVEAENLLIGKGDCRESLVDLELGDVGDLEAGPLKREGHGQ